VRDRHRVCENCGGRGQFDVSMNRGFHCLRCLAPVTDRTTEPLAGVEPELRPDQDSMGAPLEGLKSDSKPNR